MEARHRHWRPPAGPPAAGDRNAAGPTRGRCRAGSGPPPETAPPVVGEARRQSRRKLLTNWEMPPIGPMWWQWMTPVWEINGFRHGPRTKYSDFCCLKTL